MRAQSRRFWPGEEEAKEDFPVKVTPELRPEKRKVNQAREREKHSWQEELYVHPRNNENWITSMMLPDEMVTWCKQLCDILELENLQSWVTVYFFKTIWYCAEKLHTKMVFAIYTLCPTLV